MVFSPIDEGDRIHRSDSFMEDYVYPRMKGVYHQVRLRRQEGIVVHVKWIDSITEITGAELTEYQRDGWEVACVVPYEATVIL